jgi:hypothetical protein
MNINFQNALNSCQNVDFASQQITNRSIKQGAALSVALAALTSLADYFVGARGISLKNFVKMLPQIHQSPEVVFAVLDSVPDNKPFLDYLKKLGEDYNQAESNGWDAVAWDENTFMGEHTPALIAGYNERLKERKEAVKQTLIRDESLSNFPIELIGLTADYLY